MQPKVGFIGRIILPNFILGITDGRLNRGSYLIVLHLECQLAIINDILICFYFIFSNAPLFPSLLFLYRAREKVSKSTTSAYNWNVFFF